MPKFERCQPDDLPRPPIAAVYIAVRRYSLAIGWVGELFELFYLVYAGQRRRVLTHVATNKLVCAIRRTAQGVALWSEGSRFIDTC